MVSVSRTCSGIRKETSTGVTVNVASKAPHQRIAVSARHRVEDLALDALHREKRNESCKRDGGREQNGGIDLRNADVNEPDAVQKARIRAVRAVAASADRGPPSKKLFSLLSLKNAEDVFDDDHRRVHDDPEIDGPERKKIGVLPSQDEDDDAEEKREGDVDADNDRASQVSKKNPLDQEDEEAAEYEVMKHRLRRDIHKTGPVVIRDKPHAWRQGPVRVDFLDLGLDTGNDIVRVKRSVHDQDRRDDVVVIVPARLAEPRHVADAHLRHVLDLNRHAVELAKRNVLEVADLAPEDQVRVAAIVDQADAPNCHRLLADVDGARANIHIRVADGAHELSQCQIIAFELIEVGLHLEFFGRSTPGVHLNDPWNGQEAALQDPILYGAKVRDAEVFRASHLIAVDFTHQARRLDLRLNVVGQADVLQKADLRLLQSEIEIHPVIEGDPHKGESIE